MSKSEAMETGKRGVPQVLRKILNRVEHRLPRDVRRSLARRTVRFAAQPTSDLRPLEHDVLNWEATGNAPHFQLLPGGEGMPSGWVWLRLELKGEGQLRLAPVLYLDRGEGYRESEVIRLPVIQHGVLETCIHLPEDVRAMRLGPAIRPLNFRLGAIEMCEIGQVETMVRVNLPAARKLVAQPWRVPQVAGRLLRAWRGQGLDGLKRTAVEKVETQAPEHSYESWILQYDSLTERDRAAIRRRLEALPYQPLISVVMPTYNPPEVFLRKAIESIQAQLYTNWELCIADDASREPHVQRVLEEYARKDPRVRYVVRAENGHISAASNSALEMAQGEFVLLMDHDDELPEHAAYMVVEELNAHPDADIIYSDEDKIDPEGKRFDAYFKSDWNPDLFYSHNLISHLGVYRTARLREIGGFRKGLEGSQDYDLALRVIERIPASHIRHIPMVLYHWRAIPGSTALGADQKSYAELAARKALQDHFDRLGHGSTIAPGPAGGLHHASHALPERPPRVSIIIPTRDGVDLLRRCIESIERKTSYPDFELIIVDNQSTDARALAYFEELAGRGVRVLKYDAPFNYSAINNLAAREARGELLAFLNNDLEVITPEWLSEMASHALRSEVGAVGAKLYYPDDRVQHAGIVLGMGGHGIAGTPHQGLERTSLGYFGKAGLLQDFSAVTAACLVMRRSVFEAVGGFDAENLPVAYNDIDLCLRVGEQGLRIVWTPYAELYHYESATRGPEDTPEKKARFQREVAYMKQRWSSLLARDPFYSPNLTLEADTMALAWPPRVSRPWLEQ